MFSIERNLFLPVYANTIRIILLVALFCQSSLIKGRVYFNNINGKLLAASVLLV